MGICLQRISTRSVRPERSMHRSLAAALVCGLLLQLAMQPARAARREPCGPNLDGTAADCLKEYIADVSPDDSEVEAAVSSPSPSDVPGSQKQYAPYERIVPKGGPNGEPCVTTGYKEVPPGIDPVVITALPDADLNDILAIYSPCPVQPGTETVETPQRVALRFWQNIPMPRPQPQIQPGAGYHRQVRLPRNSWCDVSHLHPSRHAVRALADRRRRASTTSTGATGPPPGRIPTRGVPGRTGALPMSTCGSASTTSWSRSDGPPRGTSGPSRGHSPSYAPPAESTTFRSSRSRSSGTADRVSAGMGGGHRSVSQVRVQETPDMVVFCAFDGQRRHARRGIQDRPTWPRRRTGSWPVASQRSESTHRNRSWVRSSQDHRRFMARSWSGAKAWGRLGRTVKLR